MLENVIKRLMVQVKNFHFVISHLAENKEIIPMAFSLLLIPFTLLPLELLPPWDQTASKEQVKTLHIGTVVIPFKISWIGLMDQPLS